jgi:hypothetical protein
LGRHSRAITPERDRLTRERWTGKILAAELAGGLQIFGIKPSRSMLGGLMQEEKRMAEKQWNEMTVEEKVDWLRRAHEMAQQGNAGLASQLDKLTKRVAVLEEKAGVLNRRF